MRFSTKLRPYQAVVSLEVVPEDHPELIEQGAEALTFPPEDGRIRLLLKKDASPGLIAHECLHVVKFALEAAGIRFRTSTEEAYAYSLGDLVDWVSERLRSA